MTDGLKARPSVPPERLDDLAGDACLVCGASLEGKRIDSIYCSRRCKTKDRHRLDREARIEANAGRTCDECGAPLPPERRADARYCEGGRCSRRASHKRWAKRVREKAKEGRTCQHCGGPMDLRIRAGAKFCSAACRNAAELAMRRAARALWRSQNRR